MNTVLLSHLESYGLIVLLLMLSALALFTGLRQRCLSAVLLAVGLGLLGAGGACHTAGALARFTFDEQYNVVAQRGPDMLWRTGSCITVGGIFATTVGAIWLTIILNRPR